MMQHSASIKQGLTFWSAPFWSHSFLERPNFVQWASKQQQDNNVRFGLPLNFWLALVESFGFKTLHTYSSKLSVKNCPCRLFWSFALWIRSRKKRASTSSLLAMPKGTKSVAENDRFKFAFFWLPRLLAEKLLEAIQSLQRLLGLNQ